MTSNTPRPTRSEQREAARAKAKAMREQQKKGDKRNRILIQIGIVTSVLVASGAIAFAVYNVLVRKKPATISATTFLLAIFGLGTLLILPGFLMEQVSAAPIAWNNSLVISLLYLGAGTSVVSFLCWNAAIKRIGAGTTVLFGNLIPIISTIEAVLFLNEPFQKIHMISAGIVIFGLIIANSGQHKKHMQHV